METQSENTFVSQRTQTFLNGFYALHHRNQFRKTDLFQQTADALSKDLAWLKRLDAAAVQVAEHRPRSRASWDRTYLTKITTWIAFQQEAKAIIPMLRFLGVRLSKQDAVTALCILLIDMPYEQYQKDLESPLEGTPYSQAERAAFRRTQTFRDMNPAWNLSRQNAKKVIGAFAPLFKKHRPSTLTEWEQVYLSNSLSLRELDAVAAKFRMFTRVAFSYESADTKGPVTAYRLASMEEAKTAMYIHLFDETFEGFGYERIAQVNLRTWQHQDAAYQYLREDAIRNGDTEQLLFLTEAHDRHEEIAFCETDDITDRLYGVDLEGRIGDRLVVAIQVKASSYASRHPNTEDGKHTDGAAMAAYSEMNAGVPIVFLFSRDIMASRLVLHAAENVAYFPAGHKCLDTSDHCTLVKVLPAADPSVIGSGRFFIVSNEEALPARAAVVPVQVELIVA